MPKLPAPRCSIKNCKSNRRLNIIYNFPKNVIQRRKWVEIISRYDPEFAQKNDSELMQLGVCKNHFLPDQFHPNGKRKHSAFPNAFTQREDNVEVPSYDSSLNVEENILKRKLVPEWEKCNIISDVEIKKLKTEPTRAPLAQKTENEEVCRLCLATDVKMFSLKSEPLKQYFQFIEPCIDEFELLRNENFPKSVCYMCANSLRSCYEFGNTCAQSQTVLTEFYLIYSKIDTDRIKEYDKTKLRLNHRLEEYSLPSVSIEPSIVRSSEEILNFKQNQNLLPIQYNVAPKNLNNADKSSPKQYKNKTVYIDKDNIKRTLKPLGKNVVPVILNTYKGPIVQEVPKKLVCNVKSFGVGRAVLPQQQKVVSDDDDNDDEGSVQCLDEEVLEENETEVGTTKLKDYYEQVNLSASDTEFIDINPPNIEQIVKSSTSVAELDKSKPQIKSTQNQKVVFNNVLSKHNILLYKSDNTGSQLLENPSVSNEVDADKSAAAQDDLLFVDCTDAPQELVKDTPILSESTINKLKKIALQTHGKVELKTMFHEDGAIKVIMVNTEGKHTMFKLSLTDNLQPGNLQPGNLQPGNSQPVKSKLPTETPSEVRIDKDCWDIKVLSEKEQSSIINNRKWTQTYLKAPFKCVTCFKCFRSYKYYHLHIKKHDPKCGQFFCLQCKMYFANEKRLLYHQRTHDMLYTCKLCRAKFHSIIAAKDHQKTHSVYECRICKEQFRFQFKFDKHAGEHRLRMPNKYSFETLKPLVKYEANVTPNPDEKTSKTYKTCCGIAFDHWKSHKKHIEEDHPEQTYPLSQQAFMCDLCGKLLTTKGALLTHIKTHDKPPKEPKIHECNVCGNIVSTQLKRHMMSHTDERPHLCFKCAKGYRRPYDLQTHLLTCGTNQKKFDCEKCGRKFFKNSTLKAHILAKHLCVERPWQSRRNKHQDRPIIELED